jgi:hypothetical protein
MSTSDGSKHTPGPWRVEDVTEVVAKIPTGETLSVCLTADVELWDDYRGGKNAANARLIAASPDLLAACEAFEEWLRREDEGFPNAGVVRETQEGEAAWRVWWDANCALCAKAQTLARSAIARAEGRG